MNENLDSNVTLSKSGASNRDKRQSNATDQPKQGWIGKKRQTTFVQQPENFFGITMMKNKQLARKKSTSNFL